MEVINKRRSIRAYKDAKVQKEKIERLLRAAMQAPSSYNQQEWEFLVVENKDTLKKLEGMSSYSKPVGDAPLAIIVCANKDSMKSAECWEQDLGAVTQNILLEAVELGLGGLWLACAPVEERMNYVKEMFYLPKSILPYSVVALGYPLEEPKFVDRYNESKVHFEKW
ncbi:nitroreductase family protein [Clostridium sp. YIM B02551]|uniref:nitroreductase family protein n=1 Tax=Clostridium sp. YIM B02551 TaxID=2910679 RepID=UPI001EEC20AB|nr:nitroreductase family protein [Clostridium sp. YIM B02551]